MTQDTPPSPLERAQEAFDGFMDRFGSVVLSTIDEHGDPVASYAPCVVDDAGRIVCFVSRLSEHTHAIEANRKAAAFFVEDEACSSQIFARRRLTWQCDAELLERDHPEFQGLADRFVARFGKIAEQILSMPDFRPAVMTPRSGSFVIGFGAAFRIEGEDLKTLVHLTGDGHGHGGHGHGHGHGHGGHGHGGHGHGHGGHGHGGHSPAGAAAERTPLEEGGKLPRAVSERICGHMNDDHVDAIVRFAQHFGGRTDVTDARMLAMDAEGMDLEVTTDAGVTGPLRVALDQPLHAVEDAKVAIMRMARAARPASSEA